MPLAVPKSWSPDGRYLIYAQINQGTGADLFCAAHWTVRQTSTGSGTDTGTEDQGQFSPDGHWVAYTSNESGLSEIYVIPFPPVQNGGRWMVSRGGGVQSRWRRDGKELFYISQDWKMMAGGCDRESIFPVRQLRTLCSTRDAGYRDSHGPDELGHLAGRQSLPDYQRQLPGDPVDELDSELAAGSAKVSRLYELPQLSRADVNGSSALGN